jgi:hypothetical protein
MPPIHIRYFHKRSDMINQRRGRFMRKSLREVAVVVGILVFWPLVCLHGADECLRQAAELQTRHAAALERLAAWCDEQGLAKEAEITRRRAAPADPLKLHVPLLPREIGPPSLPPDCPENHRHWHAKFWQLRRQQAAALYELAVRAARAKRPSIAYELVILAAREDPNHEEARRLLGYQKTPDGWLTPYEARMRAKNYVWHERFGWLLQSHVSRYESGERRVGARWITAAEDERLHADIRAAREIETEHYLIRTNHTLEAGVQLGVKLERFCRAWRQMFVRYYASEAQLAGLFEPRPRPLPPLPRMKVVYFRNREDYLRALGAEHPNIDLTTGYYDGGRRLAFFAAAGPDSDRDIYHEAAHQLFHQAREVSPAAGRRGNFWIIEGIAMYMESLREEVDLLVLGGADDVRLQDATIRLCRDNFHIPLAELVTFDMLRVQENRRIIGPLYSQMAGLTYFLLHYDNGRYRDAVVAYLQAVYAGRDNLNTLAQLAGVPYSTLDKQYRAFIEGLRDKKPTPPRG